MPPEKSEQEKFLESVKEESVMDKPLNAEPEKVEAKEEVPTDDELGEAKRRRERRLMEKLQAQREENIALNERLKVISETQKFRSETDSDEYLKRVERIYGTNSPEAQEATQLLQEALRGVEARATERALERFREEQQKVQQEVVQSEQELDNYIEELEDTHNVTFTPQMEKTYFSLMEKMSPKDREGNIIAYADPHAVYEVFSERFAKTPNRAKELANRTMTTSSSSAPESKLQDEAARSLMREAGII